MIKSLTVRKSFLIIFISHRETFIFVKKYPSYLFRIVTVAKMSKNHDYKRYL